MIARPALIIYSFAPKEMLSAPDECALAHMHLSDLWQACSKLGINDEVEGLGISTNFTDKVDAANSGFRLLAAKTDLIRLEQGANYQAFLFEFNDVFGFVATLESQEKESNFDHWRLLLDEFEGCLDDFLLPNGIGETYVFTALVDLDITSTSDPELYDMSPAVLASAKLGAEVVKALPAATNSWRAKSFHLTTEGYCIWEGSPQHDRRVIAITSPHSLKDTFFHWTVWIGTDQLAYFARYLLHSYKLRFAENVFCSQIGALRGVAKSTNQLMSTLMELIDPVRPGRTKGAERLLLTQSELSREQTRTFGLLYGLSRLRDLRLTAKIATRNMKQFIPDSFSVSPVSNYSVFDEDMRRSNWLLEQIDIDATYLEGVRLRAEEGYKMTSVLMEREGQFTAQRLNSLVLIQGALLGSITIGLLMLPAFDVQEKLHSPVVWAIIGFLMSLALALPPLFVHWHETYKLIDRLVGAILGAALFWLCVTIWERLELPVIQVPIVWWIGYRSMILLAGLVLGFCTVHVLDKCKIR